MSGTKLDTFIQNFKQENLNVLYAQIRKSGIIADEYNIAPVKTRLNMMSVSKSVVSAGVGIALGEGLISLNEAICEAFPEYIPAHASDHLLNLTVKDMLTMTSGLSRPLFFADFPERYTVKDWISYFFQADFAYPPGERFLYSNFNTYMISALIEQRSGQNLLEYLRYRLFKPIGIGNPDWTLCPMGHCHAANGLYLTIDELGNFGEMLLHMGEYKGRQIVPASYLFEATKKQVESSPDGPSPSNYQSYGYGYQFWMTPIPNTFLCSGNYGQYCLVMPKKDIVFCAMSFEGNHHKRVRDLMIDLAMTF